MSRTIHAFHLPGIAESDIARWTVRDYGNGRVQLRVPVLEPELLERVVQVQHPPVLPEPGELPVEGGGVQVHLAARAQAHPVVDQDRDAPGGAAEHVGSGRDPLDRATRERPHRRACAHRCCTLSPRRARRQSSTGVPDATMPSRSKSSWSTR